MFRITGDLPGGFYTALVPIGQIQTPIGHIQTAAGSATVTRADGNVVPVKAGDLVYRGDVIETAADGAAGILFVDGTAFNLSDSARMVLEEFDCDSKGSLKSALFNLARGAFAYIAG